jgi:uncharacterized membrane protein YqjE
MTDHFSGNGAHAVGPESEPSLGDLVARMSEQTSRLIRDELRLAQAEMKQKGKRAGLGVGLFGGAGLLSLFGLGCLVAAAVLALAGPLADWLAALIVGVALFVVAGVGAILGKKEIAEATPPLPEEAVAGVKQDVQVLRSGGSA